MTAPSGSTTEQAAETRETAPWRGKPRRARFDRVEVVVRGVDAARVVEVVRLDDRRCGSVRRDRRDLK